jgi:hypothetical protein
MAKLSADLKNLVNSFASQRKLNSESVDWVFVMTLNKVN